MARVIVVANQKGGVGKTTTAVNLAACLSERGRQVLLVDMDPQGNASQGVGVDKNSCAYTMYNVLIEDAPMEQAVVCTRFERLSLAPSQRDLVSAQVEMMKREKREFMLRTAMHPLLDRFEYVIIDAPPSLCILTLNGLVAAGEVIIPIQCEYYALEGLTEFLSTIIPVREHLNPPLTVLGVLLTMYQHTNLARQVVEDVRMHLNRKVFDTIIPRNVTLSEAPSFGSPIIHYDKRSTGAQAYRTLAEEVESRG